MKKVIILITATLITSLSQAQNISGNWNWEFEGKHLAEIILEGGSNDTYSGRYCSSFYDGKKVDCSDNETEICISVSKVSDNVYEGTFESPSINGNGDIKLTFIPNSGKLKIELFSTNGEYYLPDNVLFEN